MSDIVTGEAVILDVRLAQLSSRVLAFLIDWVIQTISLITIISVLVSLSEVVDSALFGALVILFTVLVFTGYPVAFETLTRGRSIGKLALGLRVVSDDGSPERFRQALFRGLAGVLELWTFWAVPALVVTLLNRRGKRLGDIFAGTVVISERVPMQPPPPAMPPQLAAWAALLDLSRLSTDLATAAREYLSRWHQLSPDLREQMGTRIATQVSAVVAPPPPPGVPAHAYLAAVLAERRRRTEARLARLNQTAMPPYGMSPGGGARVGVPSPSPVPPSPAGVPGPESGAVPGWVPPHNPAASPVPPNPPGTVPQSVPAAADHAAEPTRGGFVPPS